MTSLTIDDLYEQFSVITADDKIEEEKKHAYSKIILAASGGENEKKLACQFICRFFSQFPEERDTALEAVQCLLKDPCIAIQKQAIHDLPMLIKQYPEKLSSVVQNVVKMLDTQDQIELTLIHKALVVLIDQNVQVCLDVLFTLIDISKDVVIRKRIISFLLSKSILILDYSKLTNDMETVLFKRVKESLIKSDSEIFIGLIQFTQKIPCSQSLLSRQEIIGFIAERAKLNDHIDIKETDRIVFLLSCIQHVIPLFSRNANSTQFMTFMIDELCTKLIDAHWSSEEKLQIFRFLAELAIHCGKFDDYERRHEIIHTLLDYFLPSPPEDPIDTVDPNFELSAIECILFTFHSICKINPDYLTSQTKSESFKKLRVKLQYLGQALQHYLRQLKQPSTTLNEKDMKARDNSVIVCSNLHTMVKDFFRNPPSIKASVVLSWKTVQPTKRTSEREHTRLPNKRFSRPDRTVYQPARGRGQRNKNWTAPTPEMLQRRQRFA